MDITKILNNLSNKRKIFVSEADFQFALAWEIKSEIPEAEVRLEYCPVDIDSSMHIDILVKIGQDIYPIELKYMTKQCDVAVDDERFILKNQGAQDIKRYDFIKDICRVEKLSEVMDDFKEGYCIAITNDQSYWNVSTNSNTCDAAFRINDNSIKEGKLQWAAHTGRGTNKNREEALILKNRYDICWRDYSKINDSNSGAFKYLCLKVCDEVITEIESTDKFWIYENWVAEKKAVIHKANCSYCNNGQGTQKNKLGNKNGRWHGPFNSYEEVKVVADGLEDREVRDCRSCNPSINKDNTNNLRYEDIKEVRVFIGGYMPENYNIYINFITGVVIWSDDFIQENKRKFVLDKQKIDYIKNELRKADILSWKENYIDKYILDGMQWNLDIKLNNKEKKIYGSNKYPKEWDVFYKLIFSIIEK